MSWYQAADAVVKATSGVAAAAAEEHVPSSIHISAEEGFDASIAVR